MRVEIEPKIKPDIEVNFVNLVQDILELGDGEGGHITLSGEGDTNSTDLKIMYENTTLHLRLEREGVVSNTDYLLGVVRSQEDMDMYEVVYAWGGLGKEMSWEKIGNLFLVDGQVKIKMSGNEDGNVAMVLESESEGVLIASVNKEYINYYSLGLVEEARGIQEDA